MNYIIYMQIRWFEEAIIQDMVAILLEVISSERESITTVMLATYALVWFSASHKNSSYVL